MKTPSKFLRERLPVLTIRILGVFILWLGLVADSHAVKAPCTACGIVYFDDPTDSDVCTSTLWVNECSGGSVIAGIEGYSPGEELCTDGAVLIPPFTWSIGGSPLLGLNIKSGDSYSYTASISPVGSLGAVSEGSLTVSVTGTDAFTGQQATWTGTIYVRIGHPTGGCNGSGCNSGSPSVGNTRIANESVAVKFDLGRCAFGKMSAGTFGIKESSPMHALSTPACLKYLFSTNSDCQVITNGAGIRQIKVPEGLANIVTNGSTNVYFIEFYSADQVGAISNGLYVLSGFPLSTNRIENPDGGPSTNRLRVTESEGYVSDYEWRTNGWELVKGGGLRKELKTSIWSDSDTIKTTVVQISDTNSLVTYTSNRYQVFSFGQALTQSVQGNDTIALTNSFSYYTNTALSTTGLVREVVRATGEWEIKEYNSGRLPTNSISGFLNQAPTTNGALARRFEYSYGTNTIQGSGDKGKPNSIAPRRVVEYLLGKEVARSYSLMFSFEERQIRCVNPGAAWNDSSNLVTITKYHKTGVNAKRLLSVERPDGTMDIYDYKFYTNGSGQAFRTNLVFSGVPDAGKSNIVDGTKSIEVVGAVGQLFSKTIFDIANGILLSSETYGEHDSYNRPRKVSYLDGTHTWTDYGCCGPITETNREGTVIYHYKDALKRHAAVKKNDITTTNVFDAAGNLLRTMRIGSDASKITNAVHTYDTARRRLTSRDALANTTTFTEAISNYQVIRTNSYPDGGTRIETFYRDGQMAKITGTAVHPLRYEYGVVQDGGIWRRYTREIKLDGNGNDTSEVLTNLFDMVGRNYKTVYADGAKRESIFNVKGQLVRSVDPDGVTTLYEYDAHGDIEYVVTDIDRDGAKDITGPDRIRQTVKDVTTKGSDNVARTRSYHWSANGSSISNLVSVHEMRTDGLVSWNSNFGVTNQARTLLAGSGNRYVTNTAADGSYSVSHSQHGQLKTTTRKDASGMQVIQATYTYDAHGRQKTMTDARNGTTTYTYDNADRVASTTTPPPGAGQNSQTTSYSYDHAGRRTRTVFPDGAATTNEYHLSGELKKTYGARAYPVEYKYDAQGRQTNMTTWQNYGGATGAASTAWKHDAYRGFMTNKVYADGKGPGYTFTPAGRLRTRTWARGVSTTYETNAAGETVGITYSDGTSNVVYNLDRLGRRTNILDGAGTRYLTYSDSGLLLMETNASGVLAGIAITNGYDAVGRRIAIGMLTNGNSAFVHTYAYDSASRLTNVSDGTYNAVYSYLANSPLVSQITYRSNTTTRMTTTKSYDYLNRLMQIASQPSAAGEAPISFNYALNDANQRTRVTHADGSYWVYEYDKLGQVTSGKKYWEDGTPVAGQQFEYAFDDIGNRMSTKEGGDASGGALRSASYSANVLNQYTNRTVSGTVDMIGIAKATATVTANDQGTYRRGEYYQTAIANDNTSAILYPGYTNRAVLSGETNTTTGNLLIPKTPQNLWYDSDGNTLSDGVWTNTWNGENRMSATENTSGVPSSRRAKETWTFDAEGRWVQRVVFNWSGGTYTALTTNKFVWDGSVLMGVLADGFALNASSMRGLDLSGTLFDAGGIGGVVVVNLRTNGVHLCVDDGSGNIIALVGGDDGSTSGRYDYDPYGRTTRLNGAAATENFMRFSTQFADEVNGTCKYLYRDYQRDLGRWSQRDPIFEQGLTAVMPTKLRNQFRNFDAIEIPYAFVSNDPIGNNDLFGLKTMQECADDYAANRSQNLRTFRSNLGNCGLVFGLNTIICIGGCALANLIPVAGQAFFVVCVSACGAGDVCLTGACVISAINNFRTVTQSIETLACTCIKGASDYDQAQNPLTFCND